MQDQGIGPTARGLALEATEQAIVQMLISGEPRGLWWRQDIEREIGDEGEVCDALGNLQRSGLVRLEGEMVAATRAALRAGELLT